MTSVFNKLNLRPFERRLVVAVGILLFVVVQLLYVWPHFGDLGKMGARRENALRNLDVRQAEIAQTNNFVKELKALESEGQTVPPEDQATELLRTIQTQAAQCGVAVTANSKPVTRTNEFFLEQSLQITATSDEAALLHFLYNLGSGNSLIRVRDLTVRPDQSRTKLGVTIKLVASYQKRTPLRTPASPAKIETNSAGSRPAGSKKPDPARPAPSPPSPATRK